MTLADTMWCQAVLCWCMQSNLVYFQCISLFVAVHTSPDARSELFYVSSLCDTTFWQAAHAHDLMVLYFSADLIVLVCSMAFPGQHKSLSLAKIPQCCACRPAKIPHSCLYKPVSFLVNSPSSPDSGISSYMHPYLSLFPINTIYPVTL